MDIKSYALKHSGTAKRGCPVIHDLATRAGCSPETLYMVAAGHKLLSARLARRVADASCHEVSPADLRPDIFGAGPEQEVAA